jgi:hypothetical protein
MSAIISISGHGAGRILSTDGARVVIEAETAAPPGASLSCSTEGATLLFKMKVSSCKRAQAGATARYVIEGRFVDVTREQREALAALAHGGSS